MDINLKKESLSDHFNWFLERSKINVLYYDCFKNRIEFNELFYTNIQEAFLNSIDKKIDKCYLFLAIDYHKRKVEDYYKVWKKVSRNFNVEGLVPVQEEPFGKYYIGLASFEKNSLKNALAIQKTYNNSCFVLIDATSRNYYFDVQELAHLFLVNENKGFENIVSAYCKNGIFIIRTGDGGEDWEVALIFEVD